MASTDWRPDQWAPEVHRPRFEDALGEFALESIANVDPLAGMRDSREEERFSPSTPVVGSVKPAPGGMNRPSSGKNEIVNGFINTHGIHISMQRKNITIREDQSEWIEQQDINLSQLVQETIDEEMGPSAEELATAYRENAELASETNEQWEGASWEANDHLGDAPRDE